MAYNSVLYRISDPGGGDYDLENEGEGLPSWTLIERTHRNKNGNEQEVSTERILAEMHSIFPYRHPEM